MMIHRQNIYCRNGGGVYAVAACPASLHLQCILLRNFALGHCYSIGCFSQGHRSLIILIMIEPCDVNSTSNSHINTGTLSTFLQARPLVSALSSTPSRTFAQAALQEEGEFLSVCSAGAILLANPLLVPTLHQLHRHSHLCRWCICDLPSRILASSTWR
jgi:hypothetical protein